MYSLARLLGLVLVLSAVSRPALGATCNIRNACQKALHRRLTAAESDCASFFASTISLCPTTTTITVTHSKTAPQFKITSTITTTSTTVTTDQELVLVTSDFFETSYTLYTIYLPPVTTPIVEKRAAPVQHAGKDDHVKDLLPREATCTAMTILPTHIPAYASSQCPGSVAAYSSACACLGASPQAKTLSQRTVTKTTTTIVTFTPPPKSLLTTDVVYATSVLTLYTTSQVDVTLATTVSSFTTMQLYNPYSGGLPTGAPGLCGYYCPKGYYSLRTPCPLVYSDCFPVNGP